MIFLKIYYLNQVPGYLKAHSSSSGASQASLPFSGFMAYVRHLYNPEYIAD